MPYLGTINETTVSGSVGDMFFTHIKNETDKDAITDHSILTTLRILLNNRVSKDMPFHIYDKTNNSFSSSFNKKSGLKKLDWCKLVSDVVDKEKVENNSISIVSFGEDWGEHFKNLDKWGKTIFTGFEEVDKSFVSFFESCFPADDGSAPRTTIRVYIDKENGQTFIFVSDYSASTIFHILHVGFKLFLPWIFETNPLTDDERNFLKVLSMNDGSEEEYLKYVREFESSSGILEMKLRADLHEVQKSSYKLQVKKLESKISEWKHEIDTRFKKIEDLHREVEKSEIKLIGLYDKKDQSDNSLVDYILTNPLLNVISIKDSVIRFSIETPLEYVDSDELSVYLSKDGGFVSQAIAESVGKNFGAIDDFKKFLRMSLIDFTFKINTATIFELDFSGRLRPVASYGDNNKVGNSMPHPHLGGDYHCLGGNESVIARCMIEYDYIGAIEQATAACCNLNVSDSTVFKNFIGRLSSYSSKCIIMKDGSIVTIKEAMKRVKGE